MSQLSGAGGTVVRCLQPGCPGIIEDGYCNVCGLPPTQQAQPVRRAQPGQSAASAQQAEAAHQARRAHHGHAAGARLLPTRPAATSAPTPADPRPAQAGPAVRTPTATGAENGRGAAPSGTPAQAVPPLPAAALPAQAPASGTASASASGAWNLSGAERTVYEGTQRTSSTHLASAAIGSARTGSGVTRPIAGISTRLRTRRLGAGLTVVPPAPVGDPLAAVLSDPQVAESKRYCPVCHTPVGRSRDGVPGRTQGYCPNCGAHFDFDPTLAPGDVLGGQYEVVGALAHGGLGWIYLARDRNVSGRYVVLKGLLNSGDEDALAAAIAEREFLAEVTHPQIVEIYNFVLDGAGEDAAGYIVMEYVGGRSLKQILSDRREAAGRVDPLPPATALAYILEILPAFTYLHEAGLLYCDFKPENLIQQGERLKLIDLGGVRRAGDETSAIFGTVGYQAPEVSRTGPTVASDIYTIGRTLATLVLDFRGNTTTYAASLPPVADTPLFAQHDSLYRLLAKACAPEPADRFASVDEMRSQVLGVLREVVAASRPTGTSAGAGVTGTSAGAGGAAAGAGGRPLPPQASVHFEAPAADSVDSPLAWDLLPAPRVDPDDPMAPWLATLTDPARRAQALRGAPQVTLEVRLARVRAAIEEGLGEVARTGIADILSADPWEWRALWLQGLLDLAEGHADAATASFNAVYGQVPGELAPKLALATACERAGENALAERLYLVCALTDSQYAAPAAFGLARLRSRRRDAAGALAALDLVPPARASYPAARARRAGVLVTSASDLSGLDAALDSIDGVPIDERTRYDLEIAAFSAALARVTGRAPGSRPHGPAVHRGRRMRRGTPPSIERVGGVLCDERSLRFALEAAYRARARLATDPEMRIDLVDHANAVRPRTLT